MYIYINLIYKNTYLSIYNDMIHDLYIMKKIPPHRKETLSAWIFFSLEVYHMSDLAWLQLNVH